MGDNIFNSLFGTIPKAASPVGSSNSAVVANVDSGAASPSHEPDAPSTGDVQKTASYTLDDEQRLALQRAIDAFKSGGGNGGRTDNRSSGDGKDLVKQSTPQRPPLLEVPPWPGKRSVSQDNDAAVSDAGREVNLPEGPSILGVHEVPRRDGVLDDRNAEVLRVAKVADEGGHKDGSSQAGALDENPRLESLVRSEPAGSFFISPTDEQSRQIQGVVDEAPWNKHRIIYDFPESYIPQDTAYTQQLEGIIPRMGAKSKLRDWLIAHFPRHFAYCEPFGGSFKVLLWKQRSKIEIINDIDEDLIHFFRYVTYYPKEVAQLVNSLPTHQGLLKLLRGEIRSHTLSGIERAAAVYYSIKLSFNGTGNGYSGDPRTLASARADSSEFVKVSNRLRGVDIRCQNAHDLIEAVNKKIDPMTYPGGIFFYLDPPYDETAGYNTMQGMSVYGKPEQYALFNLCKKIHENGNKFMMTNSFTDYLQKMWCVEKDWHYVKRMVRYDISGSADAREETAELIVANFPLEQNKSTGGLFK